MKKVPRRRALHVCGSLLASSALAGCSGRTVLPSSETTSSSTTGETASLSTTEESPTASKPEYLSWQFDAGSEIRHALTVHEDAVYVPASDFYALDAIDGTERWRFHDEAWIDSTPVFRDGTVYFVSGIPTARPEEYSVYAIDADDGAERWQFTDERFEEEIELDLLDVTDDTVYVTAYTAQGGTTTYAVNRANGQQRWEIERGSTSDTGVATDGTLYLGTSSGLYAVAADDGTEQWHYEAAERSEPTVTHDAIYVSTTDGVTALGPTTGSVIWEYTPSSAVTAWTVSDDVVYVGTMDGHINAIAPEDGTSQWKYRLDGSVADVIATPRTVYTGTRDHQVHTIDAESGDRTWAFTSDVTSLGSLTLGSKNIYTYTYDPYSITAIRRDDGTKRWRFTRDVVLTEPTIADRTAYVGSESGIVFALGGN